MTEIGVIRALPMGALGDKRKSMVESCLEKLLHANQIEALRAVAIADHLALGTRLVRHNDASANTVTMP